MEASTDGVSANDENNPRYHEIPTNNATMLAQDVLIRRSCGVVVAFMLSQKKGQDSNVLRHKHLSGFVARICKQYCGSAPSALCA